MCLFMSILLQLPFQWMNIEMHCNHLTCGCSSTEYYAHIKAEPFTWSWTDAPRVFTAFGPQSKDKRYFKDPKVTIGNPGEAIQAYKKKPNSAYRACSSQTSWLSRFWDALVQTCKRYKNLRFCKIVPNGIAELKNAIWHLTGWEWKCHVNE